MRNLLLCVLLVTLAACAGKVPLKSEPDFNRGLAAQAAADMPALTAAIGESLAYVRVKSREARPIADAPCTWGDLEDSLVHLQDILPRLQQEPELLKTDFVWREISPQPLMTGYYEPEIAASLVPDHRYPVPLFGLPASLRTMDMGRFHPRWKGQTMVYRMEDGKAVPFYTRHQIDVEGALFADETPIAWVEDPVDAFFLQVQGSGRLRLPDGTVRHILYAGKNGHEYVSLGKVMIERGLIARENMSMQNLRRYLADHPGERQELLDTNPSYVFFKLADHGPLGAMGRTLTPMVSVATDSAFVPLGSILAVDVRLPEEGGELPATFLALSQDRGGAIKGTRMDLFCGAGDRAEYLAGHLQAPARTFMLLKK